MGLPAQAPFSQSVAGTTDAQGNCTIRWRAPQSFWYGLRLTAQAAGNPSLWTLGLDTAPLVYGTGAEVFLGPIFIEPGGNVTIVVIGATPNTVVTGVLWGIQAIDPTLVFNLPAVAGSSAVSAQVTGGSLGITGNVPVLNASGTRLGANLEQIKLAVAVASGSNPNPNTTRITVPSNVVFLVLQLINQDPSHFTQLTAFAGQVSGTTYASYAKVVRPFVFFPFLGAEDPSVDITLKSDNASQVGVQVIGYTAVDLTLYQSFPPPWLAPNQQPAALTVSTGVPTALIPEAAGVQIWLFKGALSVFLPSGATPAIGAVNSGTAGSPTQGFLAGARTNASLSESLDFTGPTGGTALPVGLGVYLNPNAACVQTTSLAYSVQ